MSLRVLLAVHGYPPFGRGGAERRAARTACGLARRGVAAAVLAYDGGAESGRGANGSLEWADADEDGVRVRRLRGGLVHGQDAWRASYDNETVARATRAMIEAWRPDLVHLVGGYLMSSSVVGVARSAGLPVVLSLTDYWWLCHRITLLTTSGRRCEGPSLPGCTRCAVEVKRRWRLPPLAWPAGADRLWRMASRLHVFGRWGAAQRQQQRRDTLQQALADIDALIAPSSFLAEFYVRHGADAGRVHVHRQGVESPAAPDRTVSGTLRVSYAGQMKAHKGVDLLLTAWSRLSGTRQRSLRLFGSAIGEDAYRRHVESMLATLPEACWAGEYKAGDAWAMLADTDVLVVPSRWVENSPNIILEAQAMRVPVVGSNLGGIAELVTHDRDGLLFEVDNAGDLARQLQRLLDDPGLQPRLSRAAPAVRTVEDELDDLARVYDSLISRRQPR